MKKKNTVILFIFFISIFASAFILGCYSFYVGKLDEFKVLEVVQSEADTLIYFEKNKHAVKYDVVVLDQNDNIIHKQTVDEPYAKLEEVPVFNGEEVTVSVIAYNRKEESISSDNDLSLIWTEPTFSKDNNLYALADKPFYLNIVGDFTQSVYHLQLEYNDEIIYNKLINSISMEIDYSLISKFSGRITANIIKNNEFVVSSSNFYVNTVIVGHVDILEPFNNQEYEVWDNIKFSYKGGANANSYILNIYEIKNKKETFVNTVILNNFDELIDCNMFKENTEYRLELVALFDDYQEISKKTSVNIKTGVKEKVSNVYAMNDFLNIKSGEEIKFTSDSKDVTLLYTTNGKDPLKYGKITDGNINIDKNTKINIAGIRYNMEPSRVSTFDVKVTTKDQKKIYISPSNQYHNLGVKSAGYTTEKEIMNKLADIIIPKLEVAGFKVLRNNPNDDIKTWTAKSQSWNADLHLALHSNASPSTSKGSNQGIEAYVYDEDSLGYSIAKMFYNNLNNIYPHQEQSLNKGVISALNTMGETHPGNVKVGVLLEIGYHDNYDDALWVVRNLERIGNNIVNTIIEYYK